MPHLDALKVAEELGAQEAVRGEAQAACLQIAASVVDRHAAEAKTVLRQLAASAQDPNLRGQAAKVLEAMDQYVGYLTTWQVAGPYRQAGKQCAELFDTVFPPEQPGAEEVKWQPAPPPTNPALFWQVDLDRVVNGDQCVVYLKTRVYVPREQKVRLEIGSDDGIKLWISGQLVHAKNTLRPLQPGQDTAEAVLKAGSNEFFAKVTQNNMGCGLCVRVRNSDGTILDGLRCE